MFPQIFLNSFSEFILSYFQKRKFMPGKAERKWNVMFLVVQQRMEGYI